MYPDITLLGARLLLAFLFFGSGIDKIKGNAEAADGIAKLGLPAAASLSRLSGFCMVIGALALVFGIYLKVAATLLAIFVLLITPLFLKFWAIPDPVARDKVMQAFVSNLAIIGGLAALTVAGTGAIAILPGS